MNGWVIFRISVLRLADSLPAALRASVLPVTASVAFELWVQARWPGQSLVAGSGMPPDFAIAALLSLLLTLGVSAWVAVVWHRYLLLGEAARGWVPALNRDILGGYIVRLMGIGLIAMAAVLVIGIFTAPLAVIFGYGLVMAASQVVGVFVATALSLRFGLVLPARTIDRPLDYGDAWRAADGWMGQILLIAVLTLGLSLGLELAVRLDGGPTWITPLYNAVTGWISLMLGTTVLTMLYLHLIEGLPLD